MESGWAFIKFVLSGLLVAIDGLAVVASLQEGESSGVAVASALVFLAVLPWMDWSRPTRALYLAGVFVSLGGAMSVVHRAMTSNDFPRACESRGWTFCQFENGLFALGGHSLLTGFWLIVAAAVLLASARGAVNVGNRPGSSRAAK